METFNIFLYFYNHINSKHLHLCWNKYLGLKQWQNLFGLTPLLVKYQIDGQTGYLPFLHIYLTFSQQFLWRCLPQQLSQMFLKILPPSYTNCTSTGFIANRTEFWCQPLSVRNTSLYMLLIIGIVGIIGTILNIITIVHFSTFTTFLSESKENSTKSSQ